MIRYNIDVKIKSSALNRLTRSPGGLVGRVMTRGANILVGRAKQNVNRYGRVDTGQMRDTIHAEAPQSTSQGLRVAIVAPVRYARWQHDGTRYIRPAPFLTDALATLKSRDFT